MTKEEQLNQEAEEYANNVDYTTTVKMIDCIPYHENCDVADMISEAYIAGAEPREKRIAELKKENMELKVRIGLSIECEKAQKDGELCLGYGGDEDEPCEQCKNCIKCECGYYQLGETEKDEQLNKAKGLIEELSKSLFLAKGIIRDLIDETVDFKESKERATYCYEQAEFDAYKKAEQFLKR